MIITTRDLKLPKDADRIKIVKVDSGLNSIKHSGKVLSDGDIISVKSIDAKNLKLHFDAAIETKKRIMSKLMRSGYIVESIRKEYIVLKSEDGREHYEYVGDVSSSLIVFQYSVKGGLMWSKNCTVRFKHNINPIRECNASFNTEVTLKRGNALISVLDLIPEEKKKVKAYKVVSISNDAILADVEIDKAYEASRSISIRLNEFDKEAMSIASSMEARGHDYVQRHGHYLIFTKGESVVRRAISHGGRVKVGILLSYDGITYSSKVSTLNVSLGSSHINDSSDIIYSPDGYSIRSLSSSLVPNGIKIERCEDCISNARSGVIHDENFRLRIVESEDNPRITISFFLDGVKLYTKTSKVVRLESLLTPEDRNIKIKTRKPIHIPKAENRKVKL